MPPEFAHIFGGAMGGGGGDLFSHLIGGAMAGGMGGPGVRVSFSSMGPGGRTTFFSSGGGGNRGH